MMQPFNVARQLPHAIGFAAVLFCAGNTTARAELPVPCGACNGGVWVSSGAALLPQNPALNNADLMTIQQQTERAILNWRSFNIGAGQRVDFNQPSSSSVALNRIHETTNPTRVLGSLTANGQVYLINQNGFLFGAGAKVDVHSLVASTLDIENNVFESSITDAIRTEAPAFLDKSGGHMKPITIEAGAAIKSGDAGSVLILAPEIVNRGRIETPDGQAVLAASRDKVYLAPADPSGDGIRGLLVEVDTGGSVNNLGQIIAERGNVSLMGLAVNQNGLVRATTSVNRNGSIRIAARQSVDFRTRTVGGADQPIPVATKTVDAAHPEHAFGVTLGTGSVTEVVPDATDTSTAVDSQAQPLSQIEIEGKQVTLKSASAIKAPGGDVRIRADANPADGTTAFTGNSGSRIVVETGASIDVAGVSGTAVPMSRNVGAVELRGIELADSPVLRQGALRGATITFDRRTPPKLANVDAAYLNIGRTVGERLAAGGTVQLFAEGEVRLQAGSTLELSGGAIDIQAGYIRPSYLLYQGSLTEVRQARADIPYEGVYDGISVRHRKWETSQNRDRVVESFYAFGPGFVASLGRYEPGYVEGANAGSLSIIASHLSLAATIRAERIIGPYQRFGSPSITVLDPDTGTQTFPFSFDLRPRGARLSLGGTDKLLVDSLLLTTEDPGAGPATVLRLPQLQAFTEISLAAQNGITVGPQLALELGPQGKLALATAGDIAFNGTVNAPSGSVSLQASGGAQSKVTLGDSARIDVQGLWTNDNPLLNPILPTAPVFSNGGSITVLGSAGVTLQRGGVLDVGGGGYLNATGKLAVGRAGSAKLGTPFDLTALDAQVELAGTVRGFAFSDDGATTNPGGTLELVARGMQIGGALDPAATRLHVPTALFQQGGFAHFILTANRLGITLDETASLALKTANLLPAASSLGAASTDFTTIASGTDIDRFTTPGLLPDVERKAGSLSLSSSANRDAYLTRPAGMFDIDLQQGSSISADPGARLSFSGLDRIRVAGAIASAGATVKFETADAVNAIGPAPQAILLTPSARIDVSASELALPNDLGLRTANLIDAGSIRLNARAGSVVTAPGSQLIADGLSTTLDLPLQSAQPEALLSLQLAQPPTMPTVVNAAAGSIAIKATESLLLYGDMSARSGSETAAGGSLAVRLDAFGRNSTFDEPGVAFPVVDRILQLGALPAFRDSLLAQIPPATIGLGYLAPETVMQGGFDSLALQVRQSDSASPNRLASLRFAGDVTLALGRALLLDTPIIESTGGAAALRAPYVALGSTNSSFLATDTVLPANTGANDATITKVFSSTPGLGSLRVAADLIDLIGYTALRGFGAQTTSADPLAASVLLDSRGDIRLRGIRTPSTSQLSDGVLNAASSVTLRAAQLYPTTLTDFTLQLKGGPNATLTVLGNGQTATAPLSANGRITFAAPHIVQAGTVRAPFGALRFGQLQTVPVTGAEAGVPQTNGLITRLIGATEVRFEPGSSSSVSGADLLVSYGRVQFGRDWIFPLASNLVRIETGVPAKLIEVEADAVALKRDARIDLGGGGDLTAVEFFPGPTGSKDILSAKNSGSSFAIVPTLASAYAPIDPLAAPALGFLDDTGEFPHAVGQVFSVGANSVIPAGDYAILPASYALLPGAMLVTPTVAANVFAGNEGRANDGAPIIAGKFSVAATGFADDRLQGFKLEDGARVRNRAEYREYGADAFFASKAEDQGLAVPALNQDAGTLSMLAGSSFELKGRLTAHRGTGLQSRVDLAANQLAVVTTLTQTPGRAELLAADLNSLGAGSLLVGGRRTRTAGGTEVDAIATNLLIDNDVALSLPEFLAVASDSLTVRAGANLTGVGTIATGTQLSFADDEDAALVRVSGGAQVTLTREHVTGAQGTLTIEHGARLSGAGSITLDATRTANIAGSLGTRQGSVRLGTSRVSIGDVTGDPGGLVLSMADLADLQGGELILSSASTIDFYGDVSLAFTNLVLDAAGFGGYGAGNSLRLVSDSLTLRHSGASGSFAVAPAGNGSLDIETKQLNFDTGTYRLAGFGHSAIDAERVLASGTVNARVDGDLDLTAGAITSSGTGALSLTVPNGTVTIARGAFTTPLSELQGLGGAVTIEGAALDFSGLIAVPSGKIELGTTTGNLVLGTGAVLDASGRDVGFGFDTVVGTPGGRISLNSAADLSIAGGVLLDVSGAEHDGAGGVLAARAAAGTLQLAADTRLLGRAASGNAGGSLEIEARALAAGFDPLAAMAASGGFTQRQRYRLGTGDLTLAAGSGLAAAEVELTADDGAIAIAGVIDADAAKGGRIVLNAKGDILLASTARLSARAEATGQEGGSVQLEARDGRIQIDATDTSGAASIDVSGRDDPATARDEEKSGLVRLTAARAGGNDVKVAPILGSIHGAARIEVVGRQIYANAGSVDALIAPAQADATSFMGHAGAIANRLDPGGLLNLHIMPGIEIQSAPGTNLTLSGNWFLGGDGLGGTPFRPGDEPGVLTLRAAGNLNLNGNLDDGLFQREIGGFIFAIDELIDGRSWSYQLVAGADLASANPLAVDTVAPGAAGKDVVIGAGKRVRTGAGDIDIRARGALVLSDKQSTLVTMGENAGYGSIATNDIFGLWPDPHAPSILFDLLAKGAGFAEDGGDIRIRVGGDVRGQGSNQLLTDWLVMFGSGPGRGQLEGFGYTGEVPTTWAVVFSRFAENIGALGGGDIAIEAGGNLQDVSVILPTTGMQVGAGNSFTPFQPSGELGGFTRGTNNIRLLGDGNLTIDIGGDIFGGTYFVGGGHGEINSGGSLKASKQIADLFPVLALGDASIAITAAKSATIETAFNYSLLARPDLLVADFSGGETPSLDSQSVFFTYGARSALSITAIGGALELQNETGNQSEIFARVLGRDTRIAEDVGLTIYPGSQRLVSVVGSILIDNDYRMFPAARGSLQMLAGGDIITTKVSGAAPETTIVQSDTDVTALPSAAAPVATLATADLGSRFSPEKVAQTGDLLTQWHAATPVHTGDARPNVISANGGLGQVRTQSGVLNLFLAKASLIGAGADIRNTNIEIQQTDARDSSVIETGRDFVYAANRTNQGVLTQAGRLRQNGVLINGPGSATLLAGRNIDFGTSDGLVSSGNELNPFLPDGGADLTLLSGLAAAPDFASFYQNYVREPDIHDGSSALTGLTLRVTSKLGKTTKEILAGLSVIQGISNLRVEHDATIARDTIHFDLSAAASEDPRLAQVLGPKGATELGLYRTAVQAFLLQRDITALVADSGLEPDVAELMAVEQAPSQAVALTQFEANVPRAARRGLLLDMFFNELRSAGVAAETSGSQDYTRGFRAVSTLFPGDRWKGDISMLLSRVHTEDGGDIRLLAPGGDINAGVATLDGLAKTPLELGIVAQRRGDVSAFVSNDFSVNASRVFTLEGGDIMLWSSFGDIDAGRGAKSAIATLNETVQNVRGNLVLKRSPPLAGSGIRGLTVPGTPPGDTFLFAPQGIVDAGDAGIVSAGNIIIGATEVVGAENISFGGAAVGVPTANVSSLAVGLSGATSAAASAAKQSEDLAGAAAASDANQQTFTSPSLSIITVEVIGYGG